MLQLLKTVITSPTGSFAFVCGAVVLVGWFIFWVYGKFMTMLAEHSHVKANCASLDNKIENLRNDMHQIKGDIQYIKNMVNVQVNTPAQGQKAMIQSNSPLSLTEVGKAAATEMGAERIVAINWEKIAPRITADVPSKNPYDIQTYCLEKIPVAPDTFFDTASLDALKIYAFQHGRTLFECMKVIGIIIRNKYFETSGIPLSELDKPQPTPQPTQQQS